ncbi:hypothetical protein K32_41660 [Kaistia sp. 32K]|uniref:porin n=1 Tax=Kaistia sp. 32K TaxID=2795690 RepID=UPI0019159983|nr:porin [Kaistia sp. 32K]BCP55549.1 hypothetical protein K32_41660 [Kaistia sp. 32K]
MAHSKKYLAKLVAAVGLIAAGSGHAVANGVETNRQCPVQDKGYLWVEALKTCIKPGGYLWGEVYSNRYTDYPSDASKVYGIATLGLTLGTTTELGLGGPLTTTTDIRFQYRGAEPYSGGPSEFQFEPQTITAAWAGATVGWRDSFFDFYGNANVQGTDPATIGDSTSLPLVAYTATLPHGFAATLSIEQGNYRGGGIDPADANSPFAYEQNSSKPDIIGALGQTTDWGRYQVSGALHRIEINGTTQTGGDYPSTWGYAVQGGVMINLPMIAANDSLYLQSAYVDGAITYLGLVNPSGDFAPPDAYYSAANGLSRVTGWNVTAQYLHNWTPTLNSAVFGGYANFKLHDEVAKATYGGSGGDNFNIGANLVWSPTSNTSLVAQYIYNYYAANDYVNTSNGLPQSSQKAHELLLMAQYTF